jgi:tRNA/tmRNA/rRNA uracil-C5-methylase (TrmA/RlmC/RlmD family)
VARHEGRVLFVRHALPGERVLARVTDDRGGGFCRADAVRVLTPSPDRVEPPCPHAGPGRCGGCDWQHASGAAQRELKAAVVREQLTRLAKLPDVPVTVQELPGGLLGWRSRVRFAVDPAGHTGLRRHRSHGLEPVGHCPLGTDRVTAAGVGERTWPAGAEVEVVATSTGDTTILLRPPENAPDPAAGPAPGSAVGPAPGSAGASAPDPVAASGASGASGPSGPSGASGAGSAGGAAARGAAAGRAVAAEGRTARGGSVSARGRDGRGSGPGTDGERAVGDDDPRAAGGGVVHDGPARIRERAGGRDWELAAGGFWQVHPAAADTLAACVLELLAPRPGETALDLYAGAGLFAGLLADAVGPDGHVLAVESDPVAADDARANLDGHAEVREARVTAGLLGGLGFRPDLAVLDPPRAGAGPDVLTALLALHPRAVAYVSCDPAALARDLRAALDAGWTLTTLRAYDCFPMTQHVETVALLEPATP